jgi:sterol desaturase/sphingolipid hydroxylase (fatty acid hydroxylase superfamily)
MLLLFTFIASLVIASFFGHVIHWALHQRWTGPAHAGHMEHHLDLYPVGKLTSDKYLAAKWFHRGPLLFTPPLLVILGAASGLLCLVGAPLWMVGVLGPVLVGYGLVNDYFHDSFHLRKHWLNRYKWYKRLRRLHFLHHHNMTVNYGILSFVWDRVFGTAALPD